MQEEVYQGRLIRVQVREQPRPGGGTERYEIVEHPGAVAVVALREDVAGVDAEPRVALVRQERPAIGQSTWELPAGIIEESERDDPERTARRELREETGYEAGALRLLVREYPSPGFTSEAITIYLATGVRPAASGPSSSAAEIAAVEWTPLAEALARSARGEIEDGKTLLGLLLARDALALPAIPLGGETGQHTGGDEMPMNPRRPPEQRRAPFREADAGDGALDIDSMLLEEFNYAGNTAYQCMEDRARLFNLYLLVVGILGSALGAVYQLGGGLSTGTEVIFAIMLLAAGISGIAFFMQIISLRQAYREALIALNVVKEYYIKQARDSFPDIEDAFRWRLRTVPAGERFGSVTFLICSTIAFLGSLCLAGAAYVMDELLQKAGMVFLARDGLQSVVVAIIVGLVALAIHVIYFRTRLNRHDEREIIRKQEEKIGLLQGS